MESSEIRKNEECLIERENSFKRFHTFRPRFFANFVDGFLLMGLALIIGYLDKWCGNKTLSIVLSILNTFCGYAYVIMMHGKYGQTIGKMAMKIKVLDLSEEKLSLKQAFKREAVPLAILVVAYLLMLLPDWSGKNDNIRLSSLLFIVAIYGWTFAEFITMMTNKKRRAIHDFIAGSVVVKCGV